MSTQSFIHGARQHITHSLLRGRCWLDRSIMGVPLSEPDILACPICESEFQHLTNLQMHPHTHMSISSRHHLAFSQAAELNLAITRSSRIVCRSKMPLDACGFLTLPKALGCPQTSNMAPQQKAPRMTAIDLDQLKFELIGLKLNAKLCDGSEGTQSNQPGDIFVPTADSSSSCIGLQHDRALHSRSKQRTTHAWSGMPRTTRLQSRISTHHESSPRTIHLDRAGTIRQHQAPHDRRIRGHEDSRDATCEPVAGELNHLEMRAPLNQRRESSPAQGLF